METIIFWILTSELSALTTQGWNVIPRGTGSSWGKPGPRCRGSAISLPMAKFAAIEACVKTSGCATRKWRMRRTACWWLWCLKRRTGSLSPEKSRGTRLFYILGRQTASHAAFPGSTEFDLANLLFVVWIAGKFILFILLYNLPPGAALVL